MASGTTFQKNAKGRYRFFFNDPRGEVDTADKQRQLFYKNASGLKGGWDAESTLYAKLWAASVANVLAQPDAQTAQIEYTVPKLLNFIVPAAKAILWDGLPNEQWVGALRAVTVSYAVNNPAVTGRQFASFLASNPTAPKWSPDWCIGAIKQMCFGPGISIWPARYNAIRPVVERLYGVDLPDFAQELQVWEASQGGPPSGNVPAFVRPEEVQTELIAEGYDLGPTGADGAFGSKSQAALIAFQKAHGLEPVGSVGPKTRAALQDEWGRRSGT